MVDPVSITKQVVMSSARDFLLEHYSSRELPIPIEDIIEIKLGLKLILLPNLVRDFSVNAFINTRFDSIVVDEYIYTKQPERTRFTIAEELGHMVLHKDWYILNGPKSYDKYFDWQENIDQKLFEYIERQAKTFAGLVLVPPDLLTRDFTELCGDSEPVDLFQLPDNTMPTLSQKYRVSGDCMLLRLQQEKLVKVPDSFKRRT